MVPFDPLNIFNQPPLHGYPPVLMVLTSLENKLSKMVGNSVSYPCKSWSTKVPCMDTYR